ncbi:MAG: response regulator transcription factor [Deltaproteobacteria bacterium]|nr:response regulator transcription factor [Deltaproteobacteria bacterium]
MFKTLIVEDNIPFRQSLKAVLDTEFPSMDIEEAANGTEALEKVTTFGPNLIFMDIKLPGINGLELTKKIKGDNASIVIIILTSYDLPEYRAEQQPRSTGPIILSPRVHQAGKNF